MQDERVIPLRLHQPGQIRLLHRRIDVRVAVVLEHPEEPVQAHINARRLHHRRLIRVHAHAPVVDLGPDVLVREKHPPRLSRFPPWLRPRPDARSHGHPLRLLPTYVPTAVPTASHPHPAPARHAAAAHTSDTSTTAPGPADQPPTAATETKPWQTRAPPHNEQQ